MNRSHLLKPAVIVVLLLAVSTAFALPRLFRNRLRNPGPVELTAPPTAAQPAKPDPLAVPDGHVLFFTLRAEGVQIYECRPKKTNPPEFEWAFKAPEAVLFDDRGNEAGTHGAGPAWQAKDGSKIVADKTAENKAPGGRSIAWLLLQVKAHEGKGIFNEVTFIQRVDTWAGLPPADGAFNASLGKTVRVKYEATYRFYGITATKQPKLEATLEHSADVRVATFSGDGRYLAMRTNATGVSVWDVSTGKKIATVQSWAMSLAFSKDNKLFGPRGMLWDGATGIDQSTAKANPNSRDGLAFTNDGKLLVAIDHWNDVNIKVMDVLTNKEIARFKRDDPYPRAQAFSGDGKMLAWGGGEYGEDHGYVEVWNVATAKKTASFKVMHAVYSVAFNGDGKLVAAGLETDDSKTVVIWDVETGKEKAILKGHGGRVHCLAFTANGNLLASSDQNSAKLWDVATGKEIANFPGKARSLAFNGDGNLLAIGKASAVQLWSIPGTK